MLIHEIDIAALSPEHHFLATLFVEQIEDKAPIIMITENKILFYGVLKQTNVGGWSVAWVKKQPPILGETSVGELVDAILTEFIKENLQEFVTGYKEQTHAANNTIH